MKKLIYVIALSILLAACGKDEAEPITQESQNDETQTEETLEEVESEYPFPTDSTPIGNAKITVSTPAGDSTNGNVPVLFVSEDDLLVQIGIDYENFDGSLETFVYINEIYYGSEQVGELTQTSLDLSENNLKPGDYTVTAVQFTENDPTKEPINLTQAQFKIEEAS